MSIQVVFVFAQLWLDFLLVKYLCQILKRHGTTKKEVIEKLKNGDFTAHTEPPLSSHGSFGKYLFRIKCSNNEYQPFVQRGICIKILSYLLSNGTST
jgi:hypothetical protein